MADIEINLECSNPKELVAQAVRAYAIGDFTNAAAAFGRATELMAQEHGDSHDSLGEIYIQYAKSLLELSREENVPFGDALPHGETDSDSEEAEEESKPEEANKKEEVKVTIGKPSEEKKAENGDKKVEKENGVAEEAVVAVAEEGKTKKEENGNKSDVDEAEAEAEAEAGAEAEAEAGDNEVAAEVPEDENCSDLQLAWEVLEVAKKIFGNRGDGGKERLAETMILLGEVAMESENFTDGINDMKDGIELQKQIFEPTSRKIAESHYKLGMAQFTIANTAEAVDSFDAAIKVLKSRIELLQRQSDEGKTDKEVKAKNDEIEEMKALIPEIEEKINDTKTIKEEMTAQILQEMAGVKPKAADDGAGSSSSPNASASAIATASATASASASTEPQGQKAKDISHLVKRKRKADDETAEVVCKKPTP